MLKKKAMAILMEVLRVSIHEWPKKLKACVTSAWVTKVLILKKGVKFKGKMKLYEDLDLNLIFYFDFNSFIIVSEIMARVGNEYITLT